MGKETRVHKEWSGPTIKIRKNRKLTKNMLKLFRSKITLKAVMKCTEFSLLKTISCELM